MNYAALAKKIYGEACELCGWSRASCDAHHIDYQEHLAHERAMRQAIGNPAVLERLQQEAFAQGWGYFAHGRLPKNDNPRNLAVLCPNCHRWVHDFNIGKDLLDMLPPRREISMELLKILKL